MSKLDAVSQEVYRRMHEEFCKTPEMQEVLSRLVIRLATLDFHTTTWQLDEALAEILRTAKRLWEEHFRISGE
jgi:hypothetical protein